MGSLFGRIATRAASASSPRAVWERDVGNLDQPTASGARVGINDARMMIAVWACQSVIADGISSLPVDVMRRTGNKSVRLDSPPNWVTSPNPFETPYTFWHKVMISMLGDGNAFILIQRMASGAIDSLWVVDPSFVMIDEWSPTPIYRILTEELTQKEILHIPAFTVPRWRRGLSPIDHAREAIGLGLAAEEFGARFFGQGTTMSGVVEHPGTPKPTEVAMLAKMLRKSHAGIKNSHAVGILTGGASWKSISITPEQAQFLETRTFQNIQIANLYRVPAHMIDPTVTTTWGKGIEEQNKFFVDFTLVPWLVRLEQAFSKLLPRGQSIKFNVDARLRAKIADRFAAYVQAVNNGWMSLDEVRAQEEMDPIPGGLGQAHYIPLNLRELGTDPPEPTPPDPTAPTQPASGDPPNNQDGNGNASGA